MSTPFDPPSTSPYLLRPNRDLATACREISQRRGVAPPCGSCDLSHLCEATAEPRPEDVLPAARRWRRCGEALIRVRTR